MESIFTNRISGFKAIAPVTVYREGKIFYQYLGKAGKIIHFNLPAGSYMSENYLTPVNVRKYKFKGLPRPEKKLVPYSGDLKIHIVPNPNKASIDINTANVYLDSELSLLPDWCLKWVLFHEIGHFYYFDERKCDHFAEIQMLKHGYNPSQIEFANRLILKSSDRRNACTKHLESL